MVSAGFMLSYSTPYIAAMQTTKTRPRTPMIVSCTVQVLSVSPTDSPRNFPTSQKPESFTWEATDAPDAIAIVTKAANGSGCPEAVTSGATRPAAVIIATVADPCSTRMTTATNHARTTVGTAAEVNDEATASPAPESISTC